MVVVKRVMKKMCECESRDYWVLEVVVDDIPVEYEFYCSDCDEMQYGVSVDTACRGLAG